MIEYFIQNASSFGGDIDDLFDLITWIIGTAFILTLGTFVYFMIRFRRKKGVRAEYITGEKHNEKRWTHYPHYTICLLYTSPSPRDRG